MKQSHWVFKSSYSQNFSKPPQENICGRVLIVTLQTHTLQFRYKKASSKDDFQNTRGALTTLSNVYDRAFLWKFCNKMDHYYLSPNSSELVDIPSQRVISWILSVALVLEILRQSWQNFFEKKKRRPPTITFLASYTLIMWRSRILDQKNLWRAEEVSRGCPVTKVFLKKSQNAPKKTCARASF